MKCLHNVLFLQKLAFSLTQPQPHGTVLEVASASCKGRTSSFGYLSSLHLHVHVQHRSPASVSAKYFARLCCSVPHWSTVRYGTALFRLSSLPTYCVSTVIRQCRRYGKIDEDKSHSILYGGVTSRNFKSYNPRGNATFVRPHK